MTSRGVTVPMRCSSASTSGRADAAPIVISERTIETSRADGSTETNQKRLLERLPPPSRQRQMVTLGSRAAQSGTVDSGYAPLRCVGLVGMVRPLTNVRSPQWS